MSKRAAASTSSSNASPTIKRQRQSALTGFFKQTNAPEQDEEGFKIFCDLDGVLTDFDEGVRQICSGKDPSDLHPGTMWKTIASTDGFYANLPWMKDGKELWEAILPLTPTILTGVPKHKSSREQKATWCRRELGSREVNVVDMAGPKSTHQFVQGRKKKNVVNVIMCWTKNKHCESRPKAVLIDDNNDLARDWEMRGGIFIHHTDTESTLRQLRDRGILSTTDNDDNQATTKEETKQEPMEKEEEEPLYDYDLPPDTP